MKISTLAVVEAAGVEPMPAIETPNFLVLGLPGGHRFPLVPICCSAFGLCQVQGMDVAYPLSLPGLARPEGLQGDTACARRQYQASSITGKTPIPICHR